MANAELIEYAKNQLKAGSSANYIRTVLIKQGWGERDVDDALGIAQAEAGPVKEVPATPAKAAEPAAKPETGENKFLPIAGLLTGIFLIITGVTAIYMLLTIGEMITTIEAVIGATGLITGLVSGQTLLCWPLAIIGLIAGIFWIISGIKKFKK